MSKKSNMKSVAKFKAATRQHEMEMVEVIGVQLNTAIANICNAVVEARRVDMEGLESADKKEVLIHEGTTLQALVESNNRAVVELWGSMAPMAVDFLRQMAATEAVRAQAQMTEAQADLLNAQSRAEEASIKRENAETERVKAENARIRAEIELEAARERRESRRRARWDAQNVEEDKEDEAWAI